MAAARAFGLAFRVDDKTLAALKGFKIDIIAASGQTHRLLPVPALYVIDAAGRIRFAHHDADYKQRLSVARLLAAARAASGAAVPAKKRTSLGLYLTPTEAYRMWKADPEGVVLIDTRTPAEVQFVGHPPMSVNVPLMFASREWDAKRSGYAMPINKGFADQIKRRASPAQTLILFCRSGGRSARAANLLAKAGYTRVYSMVEGFEGDSIREPDSTFHGQRRINGWKNAGLPWTYKLDPDKAWRAPED